MRILKWACAMALAGIVAGCGTAPASRYYTLSPSSSHSGDAAPAAASKYAISVQPVILPEQVDRPQIVISRQDSTQVVPLNDSLWAAPLSGEIRQALANDLSRQLGVLDITVRAAPKTLPVWKIYLTVQRFDSVYSRHVVLDATWRLEPINQSGRQARICRAEVQVKVGPGIPALIAGHQHALHELAAVIAAQLSGQAADSGIADLQMKGCT